MVGENRSCFKPAFASLKKAYSTEAWAVKYPVLSLILRLFGLFFFFITELQNLTTVEVHLPKQ